MSKQYYCANCGKALGIKLQAVPALGTIVRLVQYHDCEINDDFKLPEVMESVPFKQTEGKDKFVRKLDDLVSGTSTEDLRDRRFDKEKVEEEAVPDTSAPPGVQDMIDNLTNTSPAHDIGDEPGDGSEE